MSDRNSIEALFGYAIAAEKYAEAIYLQFERMFAADPDVVAFWQHYAAEERGHARWLEGLLDKLPEETRAAPANLEMLETARHMIATPLAKALAEIETLDDAYQLAHELESSEVNTIFESLLETFAGDPQATQYARHQLSDHATRISEEFPERYRSVSSRRSFRAAT
jgi:rubrerythrin